MRFLCQRSLLALFGNAIFYICKMGFINNTSNSSCRKGKHIWPPWPDTWLDKTKEININRYFPINKWCSNCFNNTDVQSNLLYSIASCISLFMYRFYITFYVTTSNICIVVVFLKAFVPSPSGQLCFPRTTIRITGIFYGVYYCLNLSMIGSLHVGFGLPQVLT